MQNLNLKFFFLVLLTCLFSIANALSTGQPAPNFTAATSEGKTINLDDYKGNIVVLEWTNRNCPYVMKHYTSKNMQTMQKNFTKKGIKWFSVISSAPEKSGHMIASEANQQKKEDKAAPTAILLDPEGKLGKLYGAKVTPEIFIIDKNGVLVYQGAVDNNTSADPETTAKAKNYVKQTLNQLLQHQKITTPQTKAYGCHVQYAS